MVSISIKYNIGLIWLSLILLDAYAFLQGQTDFVADLKINEKPKILICIMQPWSNLAEDLVTSYKNSTSKKAFRGGAKTVSQVTKMEGFANVSILNAWGDSRNVSTFQTILMLLCNVKWKRYGAESF